MHGKAVRAGARRHMTSTQRTHHNTAGMVTLHSVYSSADGNNDLMRDKIRAWERVQLKYAVPALLESSPLAAPSLL